MTFLRDNAATLTAGITPVAKQFCAMAVAVAITATYHVEGAP